MSLKDYAICEVYVDSSKLTEETEVQFQRDGRGVINETVARGLAGVTPGSKRITGSVRNAVPGAGYELASGQIISQNRVVTMTFYAGSKSLTTNVYILNDTFSHGVDKAAEVSFDFIGEWADWE